MKTEDTKLMTIFDLCHCAFVCRVSASLSVSLERDAKGNIPLHVHKAIPTRCQYEVNWCVFAILCFWGFEMHCALTRAWGYVCVGEFLWRVYGERRNEGNIMFNKSNIRDI